MKRKNCGFTLIELIVVIAIIAILALILVPQVTGYIDNAKDSVDKANLKSLNTTTVLYGVSENCISTIFEGTSSDNERMNILVDKNYLSKPMETENDDNSFVWIESDNLWRLENSDGEIIPLTSFGSDFSEISTSMIAYIEAYFTENGRYGPTWDNDDEPGKDGRYTGLGIDDEYITDYVNHALYKPVGSNLRIEPENGYIITFDQTDGDGRTSINSRINYDIIYDFETKAWYVHSVNPDNQIDYESIKIIKEDS